MTERKYWDPEMETMPLDKLRRLQDERLQSTVARAYEKTALYRFGTTVRQQWLS
jgi:phenylacetate-CoA ligase